MAYIGQILEMKVFEQNRPFDGRAGVRKAVTIETHLIQGDPTLQQTIELELEAVSLDGGKEQWKVLEMIVRYPEEIEQPITLLNNR